ncbi:unnamed protein product [marine sediment metagenome]|uniref:Uncharacterized protein n=1 Tax=marine sediment metagenome TaxID=412755 RepID=X0YDK3_9ZZZZ
MIGKIHKKSVNLALNHLDTIREDSLGHQEKEILRHAKEELKVLRSCKAINTIDKTYHVCDKWEE